MQEVRWGIIGCGGVTEVKSGPALQKAEGSKLVAVMRRNGHLAADYARRHGVPKWYGDAGALIHDPQVDAVYIATPPSTHRHYALMAAEAGKAVYVEKPMGLDFSECLQMLEAERLHRVPMFVAYYRRALPRFLKIKEILQSGVLGEIVHVDVTFRRPPPKRDLEGVDHWRVKPEIAGCGYFCDLGSHMLDLLQFYFGPIVRAAGACSNRGRLYAAEDRVCADFTFESGLRGEGLWNFYSFRNIDRTLLTGSKGTLGYPTFKEGAIVLRTESGKEKVFVENPPHIQQPLIQTVVNQLRGVGLCPSSAQSAARTNWVMDAILGRLPE